MLNVFELTKYWNVRGRHLLISEIADGTKISNQQANEIAMHISVLKGPATPARAFLRPTNGFFVEYFAFLLPVTCSFQGSVRQVSGNLEYCVSDSNKSDQNAAPIEAGVRYGTRNTAALMVEGAWTARQQCCRSVASMHRNTNAVRFDGGRRSE